MVKPKRILNLSIQRKTSDEINQAELRKKKILDQLGMFQEKKDLELLPVRFVLSFECDDPLCRGHKMSILDWEIGQLYRKLSLKGDSDWEAKIYAKVIDDLCSAKKDTSLILGNMAKRHHIFCVCGFFTPPKCRQRQLF